MFFILKQEAITDKQIINLEIIKHIANSIMFPLFDFRIFKNQH